MGNQARMQGLSTICTQVAGKGGHCTRAVGCPGLADVVCENHTSNSPLFSVMCVLQLDTSSCCVSIDLHDLGGWVGHVSDHAFVGHPLAHTVRTSPYAI